MPIHLSPRENQVIRLLAQGKSNLEIATVLSLSYETIKEHVKHLFKKCDVHCRKDLVAWWQQQSTAETSSASYRRTPGRGNGM